MRMREMGEEGFLWILQRCTCVTLNAESSGFVGMVNPSLKSLDQRLIFCPAENIHQSEHSWQLKRISKQCSGLGKPPKATVQKESMINSVPCEGISRF